MTPTTPLMGLLTGLLDGLLVTVLVMTVVLAVGRRRRRSGTVPYPVAEERPTDTTHPRLGVAADDGRAPLRLDRAA